MKDPEGQHPKERLLEERLLRRNQTLIDVVYALVLFQLFVLLPKPSKQMIDTNNFNELLQNDGANILTVVVGIIWVIIYWGQSNKQFGYLKRVSTTLSALSIVQLFLLMLYLYFIKLDNETDGDVLALFSQSICLALAGFIGYYFWLHAEKKNMIFDELPSADRKKISVKFLPEPITALLTAPLAFTDVLWYTVGWLLIIPTSYILNRRTEKKLNA